MITPFREVNTIVQELFASVKEVLGAHLIGFYLEGSLAHGGFDQDSDIDFAAVTVEEIAEDYFLSLQSMHDRIARINSWWSIQLEGSYISQHAIRRHDPEQICHPNIERGRGERLKMADHDEVWNIHRYILRERGITLLGPPPQTIIDPVLPADLQRSMLPLLNGWATHLLNQPQLMNQQAGTSLTLSCRFAGFCIP